MEAPKVNYSDFYKFGASIGILLITIGMLIPWVVLSNNFDLQVETETYAKLLDSSQQIIDQKLTIIIFFQKHFIWMALVSILLGLALLIVFSNLWYKRTQFPEDALRNAEYKEKIKSYQNDFKSQVKPHGQLSQSDNEILENYIFQSMRSEQILHDLVFSCFSEDYRILSNQVIRNYSYDIVMNSKKSRIDSVLIEIKLVAQGADTKWFNDVVRRFENARSDFFLYQDRNARGVIFFIYMDNVQDQLSVEKESERYRDIKVNFLNREELGILTCEELNNLLFG